jgi:hypothetical protein
MVEISSWTFVGGRLAQAAIKRAKPRFETPTVLEGGVE